MLRGAQSKSNKIKAAVKGAFLCPTSTWNYFTIKLVMIYTHTKCVMQSHRKYKSAPWYITPPVVPIISVLTFLSAAHTYRKGELCTTRCVSSFFSLSHFPALFSFRYFNAKALGGEKNCSDGSDPCSYTFVKQEITLRRPILSWV